MFESVFANGTVGTSGFFLVLLISLLSGIAYAVLSCLGSKSTKSFLVATSLLPMAVALVIALVNGNLGVGVAIAGAFSLVRFRSAPGTAREIAVIFIAMAGGLAFGMGYLAYGAIFLLFCGLLLLAFTLLTAKAKPSREKKLQITIPESLDYSNVFSDLFAEFTKSFELQKIKTVNMGSMFRLTYLVTLKDETREKEFLDAVRTRNGNLEIVCSRADVESGEL